MPPHVAFFSWTVVLGKILTIDSLRKRGLIIVDWCYMCTQSGESVDHLLLHCRLAGELWSMVFALFGVQLVMLRSVLELFTFAGWDRCSVAWWIVPHCVIWCIWRERNARHFEVSKRTILELKLFFLQNLYEWVEALGLFPIHFFVELIDICTF